MSIFINKDTKLIVQGITGKEGSFHAQSCREYGTKLVGGVTPNKGGTEILGVPVFNTVKEAVTVTNADSSMIFVPARFAANAIIEAADSGIKLIVCITEGIPVYDMLNAKKAVQLNGARLIGPNCPGIITPEECKVGIMPSKIHKKGNVGVILIVSVLLSFICGALGSYIIAQSLAPANTVINTNFGGSVTYSEDNSIAAGVAKVFDAVVVVEGFKSEALYAG